jgi:uncharacterized protein (TIGR03000 family)
VAQSSYYAPSISDNHAQVTVEVPSPATELWIEGQQMKQGGLVRTFETPPLQPGYKYAYTVRARWLRNGEATNQTRTVRFQPGQDMVVRFGP